VPSPLAVPPGCPFHPRCPLADDVKCPNERPPLEPKPRDEFAEALRSLGGAGAKADESLGQRHRAACWHSDRLEAMRQRGEAIYRS
jgi:hypothetical protein